MAVPMSNPAFLIECAGCGKEITTEAVEANKIPWHVACLKCSKCRKPLMGQKFISGQLGQIFCINPCGLRSIHEAGLAKKK
jgi:hypothetical protein